MTLENYTEEEVHRLFEMYEMDCKDRGVPMGVGDFVLWLGEEHYIED